MNPGKLPKRVARALRRRVRAFSASHPEVRALGPSAGMPVLFVGGTGRSGTTVTGKLLAATPDYALLPSETKFITGRGGLCDLASGAITFGEFEALVRGRWFRNPLGRGLHMIAEPGAIEASLLQLRDRLRSGPWVAAAEFVHALLDPIATAAGAKAWVDTTPTNIARGEQLLWMFPNMKLVHTVRDGRDVAVSVTQRRWGPDDVDDALDWWARRLERGFAASERLPAERLLVVQMEDLFVRDREREFDRLLAFTGLRDEARIRTYFEMQTAATRAHVARWLRDVPPERLVAFERHHERLAAAFAARGRPYRPIVAEPAPDLVPAA